MASKIFQEIKSRKTPFLIAEIGVNYYDIAQKENISPLEAAALMIDAAAESGADAVKFQSYKADHLASKNSPAYWDLTEETCRSQYELFSKYDSFDYADYRRLREHCDKTGVLFLSTPFDFEAADYLDKLCPLFKISSSDLTNGPFLKHIAKKGKPVFLSTGASNMDEIQAAAAILEKYGNQEICLLHCVLSYPTKYEDANLNMINHLQKEFPNHLIGYSDHTIPDLYMTVLLIAFQKGARVLEKHFTLDKSLPGNDHYHAMDPADLKYFTSINHYEKAQGNNSLVFLIEGSGIKKCLSCEEPARLNARRSIVAKRLIRRGQRIQAEMLMAKRPGTGISPMHMEHVVGATAKNDILEGTILMFTDISRE